MKYFTSIFLFFLTFNYGLAQELSNPLDFINFETQESESKALSPNEVTHSLSKIIQPNTSVKCLDPFTSKHRETSYYRVFDLFGDQFNLNGDCLIDSIEIGIALAKSGTVNKLQPIDIRFYAMSKYTDHKINRDSLTLLGESVTVNIHDSESLKLKIIDISSMTNFPVVEGKFLVVEILIPDAQATNHALYIGSNNLGQTDSTFIRASMCGVEEPTDVALILFEDMDLILSLFWQYTSPNPAIQNFKIPGQLKDEIILNDPEYTIDLVMPAETLLDKLTPTITIPAGYYVNPPSGLENDFTNPVDYMVTNLGSKISRTWSVTVSNAGPEILDASLAIQADGLTVIDKINHTVEIPVPAGSNLSSQGPIIEVYTDFVVVPASGSVQDFSLGSVTYTVSHTTLPLTQDWEVSVVHSSVDIKKIKKINLKIIPNPSSGFFSIKGINLKKVEIFNVSGQKVKTDYRSQIDLSNFPNGLYFLKIYSDDIIIDEKIILSK